jgi:hypothetical protein
MNCPHCNELMDSIHLHVSYVLTEIQPLFWCPQCGTVAYRRNPREEHKVLRPRLATEHAGCLEQNGRG